MINSANSSDQIPTSANTERPPPANGQAGTTSHHGNGDRRHLGLMVVSRLASAWGIETDGCHHCMVLFELRPVPASLPSAA
jgi:hypothetical protein